MIGYLLRDLSQVPADDRWLTPDERRWFADRRSAKRVADWRLGRWTAKAAVTAWCRRRGRPLPAALQILAAEDGAPRALDGGRPLPLELSLSHSHGLGLCVVSDAGTAVGCDLEGIEPRSGAFLASFFTRTERAALTSVDAGSRDLLANLIWSAKESALKVLRHGLREDTRSLEVIVAARSERSWGRLEISSPGGGAPLTGRWTRLDDLVATVVSRPDAGEPAALDGVGSRPR